MNDVELMERIERLERALEASERRLRNLVAPSADGIVVVDEGGIVRFVNPAAERLLGRTGRELLGSPFEFRAAAGETIEIETAQQDVPTTVEMRVVKTEWEDAPALLATLWDITARKSAEQELRARARRYQEIFLQDFTGDYISTPDGRILACNPAFARIFGYASPEEAMERGAEDFYPDPEKRWAFLEALRSRKQLQLYEVEMRRKDGKPVFVSENVYGEFDADGELVSITGYLLDITEQKSLEEQLRHAQKMEAVGRLAGGVAHDFNNLLTVIVGYGEMLESRLGSDDAARAEISEILRASERAAALTNRLLAFSRRQVFQPKVLDLNNLLGDMDRMLRRVIGEDIELRMLRNASPAIVRADPGQLEQVVMNLAVNSRDAMPDGGRLTIETASVYLDELYAHAHLGMRPGNYVMIAVSDTGHGMTAETKRHLFEPFFTTKGSGKGTGLGLSIVYGIVKQSNGEILAYSEPGQGSTFKVYLPLIAQTLDSEAAAPPRPAAAGGSETILLVEDEEGVRRLVRDVLERRGYSVLEALDPKTALAICEQHRDQIQLLVTDVVMPQMSGRELAAVLKQSRPSLKVLFISGYTDSAIIHHDILGPEMPFLQKPFSPEALAEKVRVVLDAPGA